MRVRDLMSKKLITLNSGISLSDAARIFFEKNIDGAPVVDDEGVLIGLLTKTKENPFDAPRFAVAAAMGCWSEELELDSRTREEGR